MPDVFEDEEPVDEKLKALISRVEDIAATDLAQELRAPTESLKTRWFGLLLTHRLASAYYGKATVARVHLA